MKYTEYKGILLSLTFFILLGSSLYGQDKAYMPTKQVGVDFTFINNFLPLDNNIGFSGLYDLYYQKNISADKIKRFALDLDLDGSHLKEENLESPVNSTRINVDARFGKGKRTSLYEKIDFLYGLDFVPSIDVSTVSISSSINNPASKRNTQQVSLGFGPFAALEYHVTHRISFQIEARYYLFLSYMREKVKIDNVNPDNSNVLIEYETSRRLPTTLILYYHF